jgi:TATA-box binding protein (TBP) (component of TFIID and TFIIIB)
METVKISTITLSTHLPNCQLNLTNIGKYLDIDDEIIGLKYNYADISIMKGKYSTTIYKKSKVKDIEKINKKLFYNQVTIILKYNDRCVNVKLFGNGSLHLTGCKSIDDGVFVTKSIYTKLKTLSNRTLPILLTKDINNVLVDKDKLVYSYTNCKVIGYYKSTDKKYIIHNKEFVIDTKTKMFISDKMETKRRRFIYNLDGEYVGFSKIELLKNRNKFYKKNTNIHYDIPNGLIYHNHDNIIGKITYDIDQTKITDTDYLPDIIEIDYNCNPFIIEPSTFTDRQGTFNSSSEEFITQQDIDIYKTNIDLNVNCMNIYFTLNYKINRQRLYDKISESNYICKYKPESYSGIKMIYKIPCRLMKKKELEEQSDTFVRRGICVCSDKCTCTNITFLIFQSGNVIATGFKSQEQITLAVQDFLSLCDKFKKNIQKKTFSIS